MRPLSRRVGVFVALIVAACSGSNSSDGAPDPDSGAPTGAENGSACNVGSDCASKVCTANTCATPTSTDGVKNGAETDVDCGGPTAPKCAASKACAAPLDCLSGACTANVCSATPTDGIKDGDESDIDCGGAVAPACVDGKSCAAAKDCASQVCGADKKCVVPTATDGVKNGDESDIDCGGTTTVAPKCVVGKSCAAQADCASDACSYKKVCIPFKSCTAHFGGDTCGPTDLEANHESCCTTISGSPLDKYNITAGRFRQFVERTNGDLRAWAKGQNAPGWNHAWDAYLPTMLDNLGNTPDDNTPFTGVYQELGPYVHAPGATGANEGCYVAGNGARSYRLPDAVNTRMGDKQSYSQDILDQKPINCVPAFMIAAFCYWDGGRMPTRAEFNAAWGATTYPWGASPAPAGWPAAYDSDATGIAFTPAGGDVKRANYYYNFWFPATKVGTDYTVYIAPPGRFPLGAGPKGHQDLAGLFQYEGLVGTTADWSKSGSWQGHQIPYPDLSRPASNKYWATGGRCAR